MPFYATVSAKKVQLQTSHIHSCSLPSQMRAMRYTIESGRNMANLIMCKQLLLGEGKYFPDNCRVISCELRHPTPNVLCSTRCVCLQFSMTLRSDLFRRFIFVNCSRLFLVAHRPNVQTFCSCNRLRYTSTTMHDGQQGKSEQDKTRSNHPACQIDPSNGGKSGENSPERAMTQWLEAVRRLATMTSAWRPSNAHAPCVTNRFSPLPARPIPICDGTCTGTRARTPNRST